MALSIALWVVLAVGLYELLGIFNWPRQGAISDHLDYSYHLWAESRLALAIFGGWLAVIVFSREPTADHLGLSGIRNHTRLIVRDIAFGLLLGPIALGAVLLIGLVGGWFTLQGLSSLTDAAGSLLLGAVLFLMVGVVEEVTTRGGLVAGLSHVVGWPIALVISTLTFVALHINNPGASPAALVGIGMAGLVFAFALLRSGALWLPIAFHTSWDWAETSLYGFRDSGLPPAGALRLIVDDKAPDWLTGGQFGPEASVPVLIVLFCVLVTIAWYYQGRLTVSKPILLANNNLRADRDLTTERLS